jgi:hypothetical protein
MVVCGWLRQISCHPADVSASPHIFSPPLGLSRRTGHGSAPEDAGPQALDARCQLTREEPPAFPLPAPFGPEPECLRREQVPDEGRFMARHASAPTPLVPIDDLARAVNPILDLGENARRDRFSHK